MSDPISLLSANLGYTEKNSILQMAKLNLSPEEISAQLAINLGTVLAVIKESTTPKPPAELLGDLTPEELAHIRDNVRNLALSAEDAKVRLAASTFLLERAAPVSKKVDLAVSDVTLFNDTLKQALASYNELLAKHSQD